MQAWGFSNFAYAMHSSMKLNDLAGSMVENLHAAQAGKDAFLKLEDQVKKYYQPM